MGKYKIAVIVGSLRKESYNLKTAKALIALAPQSLTLEMLIIGDLPIFNEDLESTPPNKWLTFRKQITAADGILFLTPEYNRSVPGVLKNAIDVGFPPLWRKFMRRKTCCYCERFYRGHQRLWRKSPPAPMPCLYEYAYYGATRSLHWPSRRFI